MRQISRTTNPTDLVHVDKKHILVRVFGDAPHNRAFVIERLDYVSARIEPDLIVGCIAQSGNSEEYFSLGPVRALNAVPLGIRGLATDRPLKFRFLFTEQGTNKLSAYVDGVRAANESGELGTSLVDIEPADLDGIAWRLVLPESLHSVGDKPNVLVERSIFSSPQAAATNAWFGSLVMPEVMRQIAWVAVRHPAAIEDAGTWLHSWSLFFAGLGASDPPDYDEGDFGIQEAWVTEVVRAFASKGAFRHHLSQVIAELEGEGK